MRTTLTRLALRRKIRQYLGEPEGTEKNWSNVQLNEDIRDALQEIATFGTIRGYVETLGDGGATYDIPSNILKLELISVGDTEYRLIHPNDSIWFKDYTDCVVVNESSWEVTFPADIESDSTIRFLGKLDATELDDDDAASDGIVLNIDDRYKDLIVDNALMRACKATEDDFLKHKQSYDERLERFGLKALNTSVQYSRVRKVYPDLCPY